MVKETKMSFEGLLYYGTAGTTASSELLNVRDVTINTTPQKGDTTVKGDGTAPPVSSSRVVQIDHTLEFTMLNKSDDTFRAAMLVKAAAGEPVALRGKDHTAGKGPDFDYTLDVTNGRPWGGEQTYQFSCEPTDEAGRDPILANLYV